MSVQALVNLVVVGVALAVRVRSLEPLRLRSPGGRWLLVGLAAGVGLKLVTVGIVMAWQALTGDTGNPQQFLIDGVTAGGWSLVVMLVVGGCSSPSPRSCSTAASSTAPCAGTARSSPGWAAPRSSGCCTSRRW